MRGTFYIKVNQEATYRSFQKVCNREGVSVSEKIMKWIYDYMASHGEGNPQTILDYAGEIMTLPRWKTCKHSGGVRVQGTIYCDPGRSARYMPPYWRVTKCCESCEAYETGEIKNDSRLSK